MIEGFNITVYNTIRLPLKRYLLSIGDAVTAFTKRIVYMRATVETIIGIVRDWAQQNAEAVRGIALVGGAVVGLSAGIPIVATLAAGFLKLGGAIAAMSMTPFGLLLVSLGAVATGLAALTGQGETVVKRLISGFGQLGKYIKSVFATTENLSAAWARSFDAIGEGLLQLWLTITRKMTLGWIDLVHELKGVWRDFGSWFISSWTRISATVADTQRWAQYQLEVKKHESNMSLTPEERAGRIDIATKNYEADQRIRNQARQQEYMMMAGITETNRQADDAKYQRERAAAMKEFNQKDADLAKIIADRDKALLDELADDTGESKIRADIEKWFKGLVPPEFAKRFKELLAQYRVDMSLEGQAGKKTPGQMDGDGEPPPIDVPGRGSGAIVGLVDLGRKIQEAALRDQQTEMAKRQTIAAEKTAKNTSDLTNTMKNWTSKFGDGRLEQPKVAVYSA